MSKDRELRRMRMDMLRTRAALERAEVTSAIGALGSDAARLRGAATTLKGLGGLVRALSGRGSLMSGPAAAFSPLHAGPHRSRNAGGIVAAVIDQLVRRPWLAALALKGLRSAKHHPGIAAAAAVGVTVAVIVAKRRRDPSDDIFSAPMG